MRITDLISKAFIGGDWSVGYREIGTNGYTIIPVKKGWIADPFLFEYKGEHYLFVEYVNGKKGEIAYFKFIDRKPVFQKVIISESYHLSYPCIFMHEGDVYMIPESADHHSIDLYKAEVFPDKWTKVCQLEKGIYFDTTFVSHHGKEYLFSYRPKKGCFELVLFSLDIVNHKIEQIGKIQYKENIGRPAGMLYEEDQKLIRPAQDCSRKYGENLLFYYVNGLDNGRLAENYKCIVSANETDSRYQRIHTYNRDSAYETVDFFKEKFHLFRPIKLTLKIIKQRL